MQNIALSCLFFDVAAVQRIYLCDLTPEEYVATEAHRQIRPDEICPICGGCDCLQAHGTYERGITQKTGIVGSMCVARFLCVETGRTVSYLPSFALSYRLVQASTFEAFLEGRLERQDVQRWAELLRQYSRRMRVFGAELLRVVGGGFGRAPPAPSAAGSGPRDRRRPRRAIQMRGTSPGPTPTCR